MVEGEVIEGEGVKGEGLKGRGLQGRGSKAMLALHDPFGCLHTVHTLHLPHFPTPLLPPQVPFMLLAADVANYWFHRASHENKWLFNNMHWWVMRYCSD